MTPDQAEKFKYNILDLTKVWPEDEYKPRRVGQLVLNRNPENYFAEIEQVNSFSWAFLVSSLTVYYADCFLSLSYYPIH